MNFIPEFAHEEEFLKWLKLKFPSVGLHKISRPSQVLGVFGDEWQFGSELTQAMYEAYLCGRIDEQKQRIRNHKIYGDTK